MASATATPTAVVVTPPQRKRTRPSTAPAELIASMKEQIKDGWVSDGVTYNSKKEASNKSVTHRRALIRSMGGDPNDKNNGFTKRIKSQTWELFTDTGKVSGEPTAEADGGKATGKWVFALALGPEATAPATA